MILVLDRLFDTGKATFGRLETQDCELLCVTLEQPWRDNQRAISCIPAGTYKCRRATHHPGTPKQYEVFEVCGVPHRSAIHIHIGNTTADTEGCILVGTDFDGHLTFPRISQSRAAFERLMAHLEGVTEFDLTVLTAAHGS